MDVQVDGGLVRSEREKRAWSQEHLAGAAGIGARTIQRIEATGIASYESARAVSAALEIPLGRLRAGGAPEQTMPPSSAGAVPSPPAVRRVAPRQWRVAASWLGAAVGLTLFIGMAGFLLLHDYQKVRVLRTFEQWVTEAEPSAAQR